MILKGKLIKSLFVFLLFPTLFLAQLKNSSNQADYLIITPSKFSDELTEFVNWREEKGFNRDLIELNNIYSEFQDSLKQNSIRKFISYALSNWSDPKPEYVLLVGGVELLPSYRVESRFINSSDLDEDTVSIDEWFAVNLNEDDTEPDIKIGRFPANTKQDLQNIINKTIYWEDGQWTDFYQTDITNLTDMEDSTLFNKTANFFINRHFAENYRLNNIFTSKDTIIENSRERLKYGINEGTLFLNYFGHGNKSYWSRYQLFTLDDVDSLVTNQLPFILSSIACSQNIDFPSENSLVKKLMVAEDKGAVASVAYSGLGYAEAGKRFFNIFYFLLMHRENTTLGEAVLSSKEANFNGAYSSIMRRFTLLGDPALKLPNGVIASIPAESVFTISNYKLKQNYPNPFNPTTKIEYSVFKQGKVTIKVFDLLGKEMATLIDEQKQPGNYHVNFGGINLSSGVYFYQMKINDFVDIKKCILLK